MTQSLPTFSVLGNGPLVLLLHGSGGGGCLSFAPQVEALAGQGYRAVSWNMPGYGHSAPIEPMSFKGLAASCVALLQALVGEGGGSAALVGHGMGGMVAQEVALRRPDLARQLVLVATDDAVRPDEPYGRYVAQCLQWLEAGQDMAAIAELLLPRLVGPGALPEGVRLAAHGLATTPAPTWRRSLQAMLGFDRRASLAELRLPTLVVAGEHDRTTPPAGTLALAQRIAGAHHELLRGAGHIPHLEQPDAFDGALLDFLAQTPHHHWLH